MFDEIKQSVDVNVPPRLSHNLLRRKVKRSVRCVHSQWPFAEDAECTIQAVWPEDGGVMIAISDSNGDVATMWLTQVRIMPEDE